MSENLVMERQKVTENTVLRRYELVENGLTAFADYQHNHGVLFIKFVFAPPELRGKGTAGRLMQGMLDDVRSKGLKVTPICGYAAAWLHRHKQYHDLMA